MKDENGQLSTSLKETCEIMNKVFERIFIRDCSTLPALKTFQGDKLSVMDVKVEEVHKLLSDLKPHSAAEPGGVHPSVKGVCRNSC